MAVSAGVDKHLYEEQQDGIPWLQSTSNMKVGVNKFFLYRTKLSFTFFVFPTMARIQGFPRHWITRLALAVGLWTSRSSIATGSDAKRTPIWSHFSYRLFSITINFSMNLVYNTTYHKGYYKETDFLSQWNEWNDITINSHH